MKERGTRKKMIGRVISHKMDKTAVVSVSRLRKHASYKKYITGQKIFKAHDPKNSCGIGDKVRLIESKPISKTKRWQVLEIMEKGQAAEGEKEGSNPLEQSQ